MSKFKIGDKVNYVRAAGKYRCIIRVLPKDTHDTYCVELLDNPGSSADFNCHTCDGFIPSGLGQWAWEESLELVDYGPWPPKTPRQKYKGFTKCTQLKS